MVITQVEAEGHAIALNLVTEYAQWRMNKLSGREVLDIIAAKRSGASDIDRQRANEFEGFVNNQKV